MEATTTCFLAGTFFATLTLAFLAGGLMALTSFEITDFTLGFLSAFALAFATGFLTANFFATGFLIALTGFLFAT
ncbi:MAG: hypothetical protein KA365_00475 [Arenimonas sp.]|nr:hypothetical protein [Arenimonas sp.]